MTDFEATTSATIARNLSGLANATEMIAVHHDVSRTAESALLAVAWALETMGEQLHALTAPPQA